MSGVDEEPRIVEMKEDEWLSPEDLRVQAEEKARVQREVEEARRASARAWAASSSSSSSWSWGGAQWSSAASDAALGAACVWSALRLLGPALAHESGGGPTLLLAVLGLALAASAALCRAAAFAGLAPLVPAHHFLTTLATLLGLVTQQTHKTNFCCFSKRKKKQKTKNKKQKTKKKPLVAACIVLTGEFHLSSHQLHALLPLLLILTGFAVQKGLAKKLGMPLSSLGGAAIAVKGLAQLWRGPASAGFLWLAGFGLILGSGYFVQPNKKNVRHGPFHMLGVDVFHYLFALGMILLGIGIEWAMTDSPRLFLLYYFVRQ